MRATLPAVLTLALAGGCVHRYVEPRPDEPHALVRVRIVHHQWAGPQLEEWVRLNDLDIPIPPAMNGVATTHAVRVRPEATAWRFGTQFFHMVTRWVTRTYTRQVPCGTTYGGFGTSRYSQTRYCPQTEQRTEPVRQRVVDASCTSSTSHVPQAGGAYVLQYDFFANDQCTLRCLRQVPAPDGVSFTLMPCGAHEPPGILAPPPALTAGGEAPPASRPEIRPAAEDDRGSDLGSSLGSP